MRDELNDAYIITEALKDFKVRLIRDRDAKETAEYDKMSIQHDIMTTEELILIHSQRIIELEAQYTHLDEYDDASVKMERAHDNEF